MSYVFTHTRIDWIAKFETFADLQAGKDPPREYVCVYIVNRSIQHKHTQHKAYERIANRSTQHTSLASSTRKTPRSSIHRR